ncbi:MAG: peptide-methionine (S)-S-oxide reductase MsrA [Bacteroidota bacterium]|nr:peptide-methionine (S)-S-oxide reductase MsrA [Bacteroidota bacterium]
MGPVLYLILIIMPNSPSVNTETATFGAGCFWCVEAVFESLKGVESVESGYSGGFVKNPSYREVCNGTTGHTEVVQVVFNPQIISFEELLEVFWKTHDPTTTNRQGADVGSQYRSAIFYHSEKQKEHANNYKDKLNKSGVFDKPIVTEISPLVNFYKAEENHQDYFSRNPNQPYCSVVINPKLEKMNLIFKEKLKK